MFLPLLPGASPLFATLRVRATWLLHGALRRGQGPSLARHPSRFPQDVLWHWKLLTREAHGDICIYTYVIYIYIHRGFFGRQSRTSWEVGGFHKAFCSMILACQLGSAASGQSASPPPLINLNLNHSGTLLEQSCIHLSTLLDY